MTDAQRLDDLEASLTNWTPGPGAVNRIEHLRAAARNIGAEIIRETRHSRERALALTHLEETVMWAVKAIILEDRADTLIREGLGRQMEEQ